MPRTCWAKLQVYYQKVRQASITTEINEIVSGAESAENKRGHEKVSEDQKQAIDRAVAHLTAKTRGHVGQSGPRSWVR